MPGPTTRSKTRRRLAAAAVLIAASFAAIRFDAIRVPLTGALAPVGARLQSVGATMRSWQERGRTLEAAEREIERLQKIATDLAAAKAELESLRVESTELRELAGYRPTEKLQPVTAAILGFDSSPVRSFMLIDAGTEQGLADGQAVLSPDGFLLGIVERADGRRASVRLLKDPRSKIAASISGVKDSNGIVMPIEGGSIALRYLGENLQIKSTGVVVTASLESSMPAGIPIGTIEVSVRETETPFQRAVLSIPQKPETLRFVSVLTRTSL